MTKNGTLGGATWTHQDALDRRQRGGSRGAGGWRTVRAEVTGKRGPATLEGSLGQGLHQGSSMLSALRRNWEGREGSRACRRGEPRQRRDLRISVRPPPEARDALESVRYGCPHPQSYTHQHRRAPSGHRGWGVSANDTLRAGQGTIQHCPGDGEPGL